MQVSLAGRKAVLKGAVKTAHDRVLAEQLLLLEPGVSDVVNQLVVAVSPETVMSPPGTLPVAPAPKPTTPIVPASR